MAASAPSHEPVQDLDAQVFHPADCVDRIHAGAAGEDGQAAEEGALALFEQVVAPVDGAAQRLLALGPVTRAAGEQVETPSQAREHGLRREDVDPRRRQLDREWQAVEP